MCAPRVTRQMSRRYSHSRQILSSMSCVTFQIAVLMRSCNSGSVFGNGGTKNCPWRNPKGRNHTMSVLVTGVSRCRRCCLWPLHDQPINLAGVHLGNPGPPYSNVVGPRLVGKCTTVPPHPWVVALTSFPTCPGTPFQWHCPPWKRMGQTHVSGNGTKHIHFGTVTFHLDQSVRILGSPYLGIVPVDLSG